MANTPIYGWRYQTLGDSPHGPNLGANLAADVEATVSGIDTRLAAAEIVAAKVGPGAVARRAATLSAVANNTVTDVPLDTEVFDSAAMFAPTSATITIATGKDGLYTIKGWCLWAAGATGWRQLAISVNNSTTVGNGKWHVSDAAPTGGSDSAQSVDVDVPLVAGDNVRLKIWHTQGAALDLTAARLSVIRCGL